MGLLGLAFPDIGTAASADEPLGMASAEAASTLSQSARDLQLEIFVDGAPTQLIGAFRQYADGGFGIAPEQLRAVGIKPEMAALRTDGLIDLGQLPGVSFIFDDAAQSIHFSATQGARMPRIIRGGQGRGAAAPEPQRSFGALLNYSLFASAGGEGIDGLGTFEGVSGRFETRIFSPAGVLSNGFIATAPAHGPADILRLDTIWSYADPRRLMSYRVGDIITAGLGWTRPVRLGGVQVQRNFRLRPDLVTIPLPALSGSAAVPSTVDVYINNARYLSEDVQPGPFEITDIPVVTGNGVARLVVRDSSGRETVTESPFFASSRLLAPGFSDFSAEAGFARTFYGTRSNAYDDRLMTLGTMRYGVADWLTIEAHAEGGGGLVNTGAGLVFGLGPYGVATIAAAASDYEGRVGTLLDASVELRQWGLQFFARTQRTSADYADIALVTAEGRLVVPQGIPVPSAAPPKALDQVSVALPLGFDPATINLTYTGLKTADGVRSRILAASLNRHLGKGANLFMSGFVNLDEDDSYGLFAGLSLPFGDDIRASSGLSIDRKGASIATELSRSERAEIGSLGWRLRDVEGAVTNRAAAVSYRAPFARLEARLDQSGDFFRAAIQADGAIVTAGGDVFASEWIDDAFAIVDAGAANVGVRYENQPVGRTGKSGKLLVPRLRSFEQNQISIDLSDLPVDAVVTSTSAIAVPAEQSGAVVRFEVPTDARTALVTLRDEQGEAIEPGASGVLEGAAERFIIGYDGQAFIAGLDQHNRVVLDLPRGGRCAAEFDYQPRKGEQVSIDDLICRTIQ